MPVTGLSDHFPVCCSLYIKTVKPAPNVNSSIVYQCLKKKKEEEEEEEGAILIDLHVTLFENVYNFSDPN